MYSFWEVSSSLQELAVAILNPNNITQRSVATSSSLVYKTHWTPFYFIVSTIFLNFCLNRLTSFCASHNMGSNFQGFSFL
jgi:hypothetical protein